MNKLRPYQERDLKNIEEAFLTSNSILYQAPTGSGKSVVLEKIILKYQKEKLLILVHKRELVFQLKKRLEASNLKVGIIIGNIEENIDSNIIIASIRTVTLEKRIETILEKNFDKLFIDEAHHTRTSSYENVLDKYLIQNKDHKLLGLTATPYRKDKKPLNKYYKVLICSDSIDSLQKQGYLSKYKVFYTPTPEIDSEVEGSNTEYQIQSLSNYMRKPEMLQFLVDSYKKEGKEGQMIIFCVDKKHAKDVQDIYKKNGYTSIAHIDSDTQLDERAKILKRFEDNKLQIITCIETLTEGVDLPETKVIQLARPTKSLILYLQMVGRGARLKTDNSECIILDNAGCSLEHKLPNSPREWSLNPNINPSNPGKKHKIVGKRIDGTFTEDENEMSFLELIEMTAEDYAMNIDGGIEKSEKLNEDYDNQCRKILEDLGNWFLEKSKIKDHEFNKKHLEGPHFDKEKIQFFHKKTKIYFIIRYKKTHLELECDNVSSWRMDYKLSLEYLENKIIQGKVSEELIKEKTYKHILDEFSKVKEIQDLKININELKNQKKDFENEQYKIKLSQYLILNPNIEVKKSFTLGKYFRNEDTGYYYNINIKSYNKIILSKNKLNLNNEITFLNDEGDKKIKQVKSEKLIEILKGENWEIPLSSELN